MLSVHTCGRPSIACSVVSRAGEGRSSAEAALKIRDVSSVKRGDLLRALRDRLDCAKVPLLDVDDALDAEHVKEADAALRKWREAAGAQRSAIVGSGASRGLERATQQRRVRRVGGRLH